jgi:hypothetical protein
MKPSAIAVERGSTFALNIQPSGVSTESAEESCQAQAQAIPLHPLGVKPSGNQYTATVIARKWIGYYGIWPDEMLAIFLEYLESQELLRLGLACKFLYAFCRSDDLWKSLFIE